jgi:ferredoxin--NADP+ reductase
LCGNPAMIEDMVALLADEGFREHSRKEPGHVFVEKYW